MTAAEVVTCLRAAGLTVATAESLTGGLVCAALVDVPGASEVVRGGVVAYATDVKVELLGVDQGVLDRSGPVHPAVARGLAEGTARLLRADVGIGTTGVAGPGPADGRPAGTVYVAASLAGRTRVRRLALVGTRRLLRRASVGAALALTLGLLADREQNLVGPLLA